MDNACVDSTSTPEIQAKQNLSSVSSSTVSENIESRPQKNKLITSFTFKRNVSSSVNSEKLSSMNRPSKEDIGQSLASNKKSTELVSSSILNKFETLKHEQNEITDLSNSNKKFTKPPISKASQITCTFQSDNVAKNDTANVPVCHNSEASTVRTSPVQVTHADNSLDELLKHPLLTVMYRFSNSKVNISVVSNIFTNDVEITQFQSNICSNFGE